jgi:predicted  nucleic acid-binding Zn-ribbon protein
MLRKENNRLYGCILLSGRRPKIYFDQTQNERGRLDSTYSELGKILRDNDFDAEPYTEFMLLAKNLKEADVLVFGCPNSSKLRLPEIEVIQKYVKNGGGLMLLALSGGDKGLANNMSQISDPFGITFDNTAIKDDRYNAGIPTMPIIRDLVSHPATDEVEDLLIPSACSLKISGKAISLAQTSDVADPSKVSIIAVAESGKGRVMCVGSYEIFRRGGGLKHKGNAIFAVNAFKWLSGEFQMAKPSRIAKEQEKTESLKNKTELVIEGSTESIEFEQTLRRLVNAVFDLQKDISKINEQVGNVESNIELLRDQFQEFAEKTQKQLGMMIPAKQFNTPEENKTADLEADIKSLQKEIKSIEQLCDHLEQRYASGVVPKETYTEQLEKLNSRANGIAKKIESKEKEIEQLKTSG